MSVNKLYYLLGVLTTAVSVMAYVEIVEPDIPTQTKTETVHTYLYRGSLLGVWG